MCEEHITNENAYEFHSKQDFLKACDMYQEMGFYDPDYEEYSDPDY